VNSLRIRGGYDVVHAAGGARQSVQQLATFWARRDAVTASALIRDLAHGLATRDGRAQGADGVPLVSISDAQREPLRGLALNWAGTVYHGLWTEHYPFFDRARALAGALWSSLMALHLLDSSLWPTLS
jgi:hypothetical protein